MKIKIQTISQVEFDTETQQSRLLSSWSKILGKGNGKSNKAKTKKAESSMSEEVFELG